VTGFRVYVVVVDGLKPDEVALMPFLSSLAVGVRWQTPGMPTALVTGATSGIGAAFARRLAARGDDLVLVARTEPRLVEMRNSLAPTGVAVELLPADLASDEGCALVEARVGQGVDLLVNNAGLGIRGSFTQLAREDEEHQLRLNVRAVMRLTHAALPAMLARGGGDVINVSSVAGYVPRAGGASYTASKAYVTALSESLHLEYAPQGVRVLALCPGFTRTEFHSRGEIDVSGIPERMWLTADEVVAAGLRDLARGRPVSVPGAAYKAIVAGSRIVPPALRVAVMRRAPRSIASRR
jgi:uncharacterized protein